MPRNEKLAFQTTKATRKRLREIVEAEWNEVDELVRSGIETAPDFVTVATFHLLNDFDLLESKINGRGS